MYRRHPEWTLGGGGDPFAAAHFSRFPEAWARRPAVSAAERAPCVLFASPAQMQGGASLAFFKAWCGDPANLIVLTGDYYFLNAPFFVLLCCANPAHTLTRSPCLHVL